MGNITVSSADRQHYIDWIRVLAFFLLIFFHCAMPFVTFGWEVKDQTRSVGLSRLIFWLHQWRLPLLFFISGVGIHFSLKNRTVLKFAGERFVRLFIPLAFAMLFTIPLQVYFEKLQEGKISGSYAAFYPSVWTFIPYPEGTLNWSHMWFVVYLFVYCLLLLPVFALFRTRVLADWKDRFVTALSGNPITVLLLALPFIGYYFTLFLKYPIQASLVDDWFLFLFSLTFLFFGYLLGGNPRFWANCEKYRLLYAGIAVVCIVGLYYEYWWDHSMPKKKDGRIYLYGLLNAFHIWTLILAIVGFAKKYLNFSNPFLRYANEAVYPYYILHQTVIVAFGYYVVQWPISIYMKLIILIILCFSTVGILYHWIIKRFFLTRILYGLKVRRSGKHRETPGAREPLNAG